ncbi:MAG: hypothetical protein QM655_07075 [Nocardioidaceae bacterium]
MTSAPAPLRIDLDGLGLPADLAPDGTYDVYANGQHIWSLQPLRDTVAETDVLLAAWPKALRRFLRGVADIEIREHVSGRIVAAGSHVFKGGHDRHMAVRNAAGAPLILDKYGRLIKPLSADSDKQVDSLMRQCAELLRVLQDDAGVPAFISYGTLLGAARNGRIIGHDNDVDLAYLSRQNHPVDVIRESYRIERLLTDKGWTVRRGMGTRLNVRLPGADGSLRFVDVFTAHWVDGVLYMPSDTGFDGFDEASLLPLTTLELHGHPMPAPKEYERLLEATYGPGWRVPDPSFQYDTPRWLVRRLEGWFGGLHPYRKQWDSFYASRAGRRLPTQPTPFARWVHRHHGSDRPLVDLGTGTARDARWFAKQGRDVLGVDYSLSVLGRDLRLPDGVQVKRAPVNLADLRDVLVLGHRLSHHPEPVDLYARFLLHNLDPQSRQNLLRLARMSLRRGGLLFLEFRTPADRQLPKTFARRREFVDPDRYIANIERHGGRVIERHEGQGLAKFRNEDPYVCRLVVSWT